MKVRDTVFFVSIALFITLSVAALFYRGVILQNFTILTIEEEIVEGTEESLDAEQP